MRPIHLKEVCFARFGRIAEDWHAAIVDEQDALVAIVWGPTENACLDKAAFLIEAWNRLVKIEKII